MTSIDPLPASVDLAVVGAGIVGLAHARTAVEEGLSVAVVERDEYATGASVRNFGHGCITAQAGQALDYGMASRTAWLALAKEADFWVRESGALVVARAEDERVVLEEFASSRGDQVRVLDEKAVRDRVELGPGITGGAMLWPDIRVNPREAVHAIAKHLAGQGVRFYWSTTAHAIQPGEIRTSRGTIRARKVVVAVGHDVDRHFPGLAEENGVQRCSLRMLRVRNPHQRGFDPAVLTGFSMLRYEGFAACPSLPSLRARIHDEFPYLAAMGLNLMFTQLPGGDLTIGDTHAYQRTVDPYRSEDIDERLLAETARLLGAPGLSVRERWQGVYAAAPDPFLVAAPADDVRVVSVTSGIGMTTAFGLAPAVLDELFA